MYNTLPIPITWVTLELIQGINNTEGIQKELPNRHRWLMLFKKTKQKQQKQKQTKNPINKQRTKGPKWRYLC